MFFHLIKKKNSIFISLSLLFFSIIFFIIVVNSYDKVILKTTNSDYNYYWLKIASIAAIIFSIISFVLKTKTKINILLFFFSTFLVIFTLEIAMNIYFSKNKIANAQLKATKKTITKYEFYQKLKNSNKNPILTIHALNLISKNDSKSLFSLGGISKRHTIDCNENGYWSTYDSDRYGFNNPDSEWDKKSIDFLLIGDSLVLGSCVDAEYNIAGAIRKISNSNVLSLANRGAGPLIEYAFLREYLKYIQPKRVIWFYFEGNDKNDLLKELKNKYLFKYLENKKFSQDLATLQQTIDEKLLEIHKKLLVNQPTHSQTKNGINFATIIKEAYKFQLWRTLIGNTLSEILPDKNFKKVLSLSKNLVKQKGAKFYFVYIPDIVRYSNKLNMKSYSIYEKISNHDDIIAIAKNLNIPILDLHQKVFKNHHDLQLLYSSTARGTHPNEIGYKIIAETVFKEISKIEIKNK